MTPRKEFSHIEENQNPVNQLYEFALKNDICNKDYSTFVEIAQYKDRNPNKHTRTKFTKEEVAKVWTMKEDKYYQIILMLLYNGTRISEFLDLKKENVHLEEQYFDVIDSKTENGIRKVPIADKLLPYYKDWYILVLIANIFFIQRMAKDFFIAITMTAIGLLLWNRLELTVHHIVPGIRYFHVIGSWCSGYNNQENCGALRCYDFDRKSLYSLRYAGSCRRNQQNLRK